MSEPATKPVTRRDLRVFGFGFCVILGVIAGVQFWRHHPTAAYVLVGIAVPVLLAAAFAPAVLGPLHRLFLRIGKVLGWVNTRIILGIIFYGVFTPMALGMRLFGRDPLFRRFDQGAGSYWIPRPPEPRGPERYERMF